VLVAHIDYVPFYGFKNPEEIRLYGHEITDLTGHSVNTAAPFEEWYPAAAALQAIGLPAVPLILDEMRRLEIPPRPPQTAPEVEQAMAAYARQKPQGRADCLARCLVNIYDVGGNGAEMAYLRIQLEAQRATVATKEKANLLKFLDHPAFRPPPAAP